MACTSLLIFSRSQETWSKNFQVVSNNKIDWTKKDWTVDPRTHAFFCNPVIPVYLPRCVKLPTMCWSFSDVRHILVDVSTFTSCVALPHLGSVPLFVYPRSLGLGLKRMIPKLPRNKDIKKIFSALGGSDKASSRASFTSPTDATRIWRNSESLVSSTRCWAWGWLATSRSNRTRKAWCLVRGSARLLATVGESLQSGTAMWGERIGGEVFDCRKCNVRVRTARDL